VHHISHFRPHESVQIVIVARVKLQEEETVARGAPERRQVSEGLFSLMREGIIKSLMGLFKNHHERKPRERNRQRKHRSRKKRKRMKNVEGRSVSFLLFFYFLSSI
jgi:high-affinity Fe2+/Pb2+ permease